MPQVSTSKYRVEAGWDDVPHLSVDVKKEMLAATPPFLRDARSKGIPSLGAGAIFPIEEERIRCDPFSIPPHWRRVYALDVGWNRTAAVWGALDPDTDILYLYSEHYLGQEKPVVHASAIKARGDWIQGVIDPASRGRSQADGERLFAQYVNEGLLIYKADNAVEAGIYAVWERAEQGRLKVFSTLTNWFAEYRLYHRDEHGKIVKVRDHLMDASRYLVMSGLKYAAPRPIPVTIGSASAVADPLAGY